MFIERNFTDRATFSNYDVYPPFHSVHFTAGVVFLQTNTKKRKQNSSKDLDEIQSSGKKHCGSLKNTQEKTDVSGYEQSIH